MNKIRIIDVVFIVAAVLFLVVAPALLARAIAHGRAQDECLKTLQTVCIKLEECNMDPQITYKGCVARIEAMDYCQDNEMHDATELQHKSCRKDLLLGTCRDGIPPSCFEVPGGL